jgi:hypothetical protein
MLQVKVPIIFFGTPVFSARRDGRYFFSLIITEPREFASREIVTRSGATKPSTARRECVLANIIPSADRLHKAEEVLVPVFFLENSCLFTFSAIHVLMRDDKEGGSYFSCALPRGRHPIT